MTEQTRFGLVYDAISGIERATYKISAIHVRPRWYALLREIELAVCCEIAALGRGAYRFARCRDRGTLGAWFRESFTEGSYVVGSDPLRLARYLHLADRFLDEGERIELSANDRERIEDLKKWGQGELRKMLEFPGMSYDPEVVRYADATLPGERAPQDSDAGIKSDERHARVSATRVVAVPSPPAGQAPAFPMHGAVVARGTTLATTNHRPVHR